MKTPASILPNFPPSTSTARGWSRRVLSVVSAVALFGVGANAARAQASNNDGKIDTTFNIGSGPNAGVLSIATQTNGSVVIGGLFTTVNGTARAGVARLNADGSVDSTFNPGTGSNGQVDFVTVLPNGKILVGGSFTTFNGTPRANIVQLTSTGGVDSSFVPGIPTTSFAVTSVVVQSDGKIVFLGQAGSGSFAGNALLVRLTASGAVDTSFNVGSGVNGTIAALALQGDGKILLGGAFTTVDGVARTAIARLNTSGSVDTTFNTGTGPAGAVQSIAIQSDGQIIIGGTFSSVNGSTHYGLARLSATGAPDSTFAPTGPFDEITSINAIVVQTDGSIVFGGNFDGVNDFYTPNIARVFTDGSLDFNFLDNTLNGTNSTVEALALPPAGQLLLGGLFSNLNGSTAPFLIQLIDSTHPAFFSGETALDNGVYYLNLQGGNYFGYYSFLADPNYIYHFDLGYEYVFDANDFDSGVYLYDFASNTFFYTSPSFPFPYLYDFTLDAVIYYFPDTTRPGHYTTNPRYFVNLNTGVIFTK